MSCRPKRSGGSSSSARVTSSSSWWTPQVKGALCLSASHTHEIPWRRLRQKRGGIWAAAVQLYRDGQQWGYSSGELAELANYQDDFLERDSWFDAIAAYVSYKPQVTTGDILKFTISIDLDKINNRHQRRAGRVMRSLGWENSSRRVNGKSSKVWTRTKSAQRRTNTLGEF